MIVRLSPAAETLPAPVAEAPFPPAHPPSPKTPVVDGNPPQTLSGETEAVSTSVGIGAGGGGGTGGGTGGKNQAVVGAKAVPLEAVRHALLVIASIRPLLARRVVRAIVGRTTAAVWDALKG